MTLKQYLKLRVQGIHIYIDTINACPLKCPSCPTGQHLKRNDYAKMSPEEFEKVMRHIHRQIKIRGMNLEYFGDPFLHPQLPEIITIGKKYTPLVVASTTLNKIAAPLPAIIEAEPQVLAISFSGWKKYEFYHRGGKLDVVLENMRKLSRLRHPNTEIRLLFHRYRSNTDELPKARELAKELGFAFDYVVATTHPVEDVVYGNWERQDPELLKELVQDVKQGFDYLRHVPCPWHEYYLILDATGTVYVCALTWDKQFKLGNIFDMSVIDFFNARQKSKMCADCQKSLTHVFMFCVQHQEELAR